MRAAIILAAAALLAGCETLADHFSTDAYCADAEEMLAVSWYGTLGIGTKLGPKSAQRHCKPPNAASMPSGQGLPAQSPAATFTSPIRPIESIAPISTTR